MDAEDLAVLRSAVQRLEAPSLAGRLTKFVGRPIQLLSNTLPSAANALIASSSKKGIEAAVVPFDGIQCKEKPLADLSVGKSLRYELENFQFTLA